MAQNLTPRLKAAASLVRGGGILADIGTDHGYLPIYLVETGKISKAIAADIGKMPLENARKSVEFNGLSDKISLRLSDGLRSFSPDDADEFVFAGMGGTLIAEKLSETQWIKNEKYHFVFQPQSRAEELRQFLYENGFQIEEEMATHEGRRVYIAFSAFYNGENTEYSYADCFLGKLLPTEDAKNHIKKQISRLSDRYSSATLSEEESKTLFETIETLKEFTND
jgi:tRNA (adenine22-N1)-methyltransferase